MSLIAFALTLLACCPSREGKPCDQQPPCDHCNVVWECQTDLAGQRAWHRQSRLARDSFGRSVCDCMDQDTGCIM